MNESKFKVGDRVAVNRKYVGTVKNILQSEQAKYIYAVALDNLKVGTAWENELEDAKTTFLTELQALLRKYGAVINSVWDDDDSQTPTIDLVMQFRGDTGAIVFEDVLGYTITADNIMDYEKE